jgi:single-stranded-DNA-specific exonuclease
MRPWIEPADFPISEEYSHAIGGHPLVAKMLVQRGLGDIRAAQAFLDPASFLPARPTELPGMEKAANRLEEAIHKYETILVWGDFDVDGQTATTLLVSALGDLGAKVVYHIPVRAEESHGVSLAVLNKILEAPEGARIGVVLTCDTGIEAHEAIAYAGQRGVNVLVTDHHQLPKTLPAAFAIVNPQFLPAGHALGTLPGVGVAYKVAEELYRRALRPEGVEQYLDLTALGIVADVARLQGETRYLLQRGLLALRNTQRLGLKAIMELADLDPSGLSEEHIGFVLGPRLNAIGRLADANSVVELLTTQDTGQARLLAQQLEGLNGRRQLLTNQVYQGALAQIEKSPALLNDAALVLAHPTWPAGVIGIAASRLVERFGKPVVIISTPEGGLGRGSARSVEGVDITAALAAQSELLSSFGGHSMAAGFSIQAERILDFRRSLSRTIEKMGAAPEHELHIDGYLSLSELTLELAADLERLAPFGSGNPPPVLASREVTLKSQAPVGRNQEHLVLTVEDTQGASQRVIWWQGAEELGTSALPEGSFDLAYSLRASTYQGQRDIQVEWVDFRPCDEVIIVETTPVEVVDYRREAHPLPILSRLLGEADVQVWIEAEAAQRLTVQLGEGRASILRGRLDLVPNHTLVIWTTPPGRAELRLALEKAQPRQVVLFAVDPGLDTMDAFLTRLVGLVKYALQTRGGNINLERLAVAMAHRVITVRRGIEWMVTRGHITVLRESNGELKLARGGQAVAGELEKFAEQLKALLNETAAYRDYYKRAKIGAFTR